MPRGEVWPLTLPVFLPPHVRKYVKDVMAEFDMKPFLQSLGEPTQVVHSRFSPLYLHACFSVSASMR
jgi:hypothetical protein